MTKIASRALLVTMSLGVCGCPATTGDESGADGGVPLAAPDVARWPMALGEAVCAGWARCGLMQDQAACVAWFAHESDEARNSLRLANAVAKGRSTFQSAEALRCLTAAREMSCTVSGTGTDPEETCETVFAGRIAPGGKCMFDEECEDGTCSPPTTCNDTNTCCYGVCKARAKMGEPCDASFYCTTGTVCTNGTCGPRPVLGQSCAGGNECAFSACGYDSRICTRASSEGGPCKSRLECDDWMTSYCSDDHVCRRMGGAGQPCGPRGDCLPQTHCVAGLCEPKTALGGACMAARDCIAGRCVSNATGKPLNENGYEPGTCRLSTPEPVTCPDLPPG